MNPTEAELKTTLFVLAWVEGQGRSPGVALAVYARSISDWITAQLELDTINAKGAP